MNPNYSYDMEDNENYEEDDDDQEEGFSTDAYYVPFRIKGAKTKRRPDDPFMAMFKMYASKGSSVDNDYEDYVNDENRTNNTENKTDENINMDVNDENDEEKGDEKEDPNDKDIGTSPPLNPVIPSVSQMSQINKEKNELGGLDSLRERYYKKQLPPSFQSSALADAFQSESQQAIQNDLAELEDKTLLGGIKQSVSMITQSNE